MITFALLAVALTATVLLIVLMPLLRRSRPAELSTDRANIGIYRDQLRELDDDLAAGAIDSAQHTEARSELERRLLEDVREHEVAAPPVPQSGKLTAAILAVVIPLAAAGLYWAAGTPAGLAPERAAGDAAHGITPQQVEQMIETLAARLKDSPDDAKGWAMLGRSYAVLERFQEAAVAYAQAATRSPGDAQLLVDYADVLGMTQEQRLDGEPEKLIQRALAIDPDNPKALALAGTAAFQKKQYASAVTLWQKLAAALPPDSEMAKAVQGSIAEAQALAGTGNAGNTSPGPAPQETAAQNAAAAAQVGGTLQIAGTLKARANPDDTVFIFARAADGPPVPLAVLRKRVADLPLKFVLDDSMAMAPGMNLSRFGTVIVGARISRSGSANRQPGDFEGYSTAIKVGTANAAILIDTEVR